MIRGKRKKNKILSKMFDTIKGKKKKDEGSFASYKEEEEIKAKLKQVQLFESEKLDNIYHSKNKKNKELKKIFVDFFEKNNPIVIRAFGYTLFIPESVYYCKDNKELKTIVRNILRCKFYQKIPNSAIERMLYGPIIAVSSNGMWNRNEKILGDSKSCGEDISIILPQFSYRIKNMDKDVEKRSEFLNTFIREVDILHDDVCSSYVADHGDFQVHKKLLPPVHFYGYSYSNYPVHRYFINFLKSQRDVVTDKKIHCVLHPTILGRVPILGDFLANLIGYQASDDLLNLFGQLNINDVALINCIECETCIDDPEMNKIRWLHPYEYTKKYAEGLAKHELFKNTDKVSFDDELISNKVVKQNLMAGNNSVDKQLNKSQNFEEINMQFGAINDNMIGINYGEINKIMWQLNNDKKRAEGANNNKKQDFYRLCNNKIAKNYNRKPSIQISSN